MISMNRLCRSVLLAVCLVACVPVLAGQIGISWDPVNYGGHPVTYLIYQGSAPGEYADPPTEVTGASTVVAAPGDCTPNFYAVKTKAVIDGETLISVEFSEEIYSVARPEIADIVVNQTGVHRIMGDNLTDDVQVYINSASDPLPASDVTRVSCSEITIPAIPAWQLRIVNPGVHGTLSTEFIVPLPPPSGLGVF